MAKNFIALEATSQEIKKDVAGVKTDVGGVKTDVAGVKTDVSGVKTDTEGIVLSNASIKAIVDEIQSRIGVTADTGGSATAGSIMSKLNKIITATASGGGGIKHIQRGIFNSSDDDKSGNYNITLSGFTNVDKMIVILNGSSGGYYKSTLYTSYPTISMYVVSLTTNKLVCKKSSIDEDFRSFYCSYQVVEFY